VAHLRAEQQLLQDRWLRGRFGAGASRNSGTSTSLRVDGASDPDVESYLRFSVAGVSGTVQSARLRV
jgi:hypothetical protein